MPEPLIATVTQLNAYMKRVVEGQTALNDIRIKGEISNCKLHYSGHLYITLKDEGGVLKAVMFKSAASHLNFRPEDGMKVIARGKISVYEQGGSYQLYINEMMPDGVGELYIAYEQLKKKLQLEGLFDQKHKKPIPQYPNTVGVVTASTGAAVRDIINVITRRYPMCKIVLYPAVVQGAKAAPSVCEAIEYFNREKCADTLIVGRGGGSIEDLWAFNEECVARAIFNSEIPVISAVGHETDFTIADFVADMRAPTPSAAAEIAVPSQLELMSAIASMQSRLKNAEVNFIKNNRLMLEKLVPKNPQSRIDEMRQRVDSLVKQAEKSVRLTIETKKRGFMQMTSKLDALSPLNVLLRGYAIAETDGKAVKSTAQLPAGTEFNLRVSDGSVDCIVKE